MARNIHYPIERGDRIYVRALQDMETVLEISVDNVKDFTELIGEIRYAGRRLEGLSKLIIRNHSRGWSCERMIKFYNGIPSPRRQALRAMLREAAAWQGERSPRHPEPREGHMPFPWEVH